MSKLDEQIRRSLRGSRRDSFRDLLAGKIFRANRVRDPLERIKQLCLAALLAKRRYEDLEIDVGLVKRLYDVAICLEDVHASSQRVCEVKMIHCSLSLTLAGFCGDSEKLGSERRMRLLCLLSNESSLLSLYLGQNRYVDYL